MATQKPATKADRILLSLQDGQWHSIQDLGTDTQCRSRNALRMIIYAIRKKLPDDTDIICELVNRTVGYRLVKLIGKKDRPYANANL